MSQYVTIQTKVTDKQAAIATLDLLGFKGTADYSDDPEFNLLDWHGNPVPDAACHIRIRQRWIELSRERDRPHNDFGIDLRTGTVWMDADVKEQSVLGRFVQEYAVALTMRHQEAQGKRVRRVDDPETGKVHIYAD